MSALRVERDGHVLRVTLARPERRNAFDAALIAELTEAFADVGDARAVVLSGDGPSFCAGADVEWQRAAIDLSYDENVEDAMRLYRMLEAIDSCPAPVVCLAHGYVLGGGSGLVACADVAIADPDATFGFTEVRLGIVPAVISVFVLPKIGAARAALVRHGRAVRRGGRAADRARVGGLGGARGEAAEDRRRRSSRAGRRPCARRSVSSGSGRPGSRPREIAATRRASEEGQDGLRAFLERRAPRWTQDAD